MLATIVVIDLVAFAWLFVGLFSGLRRWAPDTKAMVSDGTDLSLLPRKPRLEILLPFMAVVLGGYALGMLNVDDIRPNWGLYLVIGGGLMAMWGGRFLAVYLHNSGVRAPETARP
jgi:hypothetical protein